MSLETAMDLLSLLATHEPEGDHERESLERIRALVEDAVDPWSRHHYEPGHLTASAVVVDETSQRALLILHTKLGLWLQPGGHFEPGERDPAEAAAREALEETGLRTRWPDQAPPLLDVDVHLIPAHKDQPAHEHFDLRFLLVAEAGEATAGDGTQGVRWVSRADAPHADLDPGLARALAKVWSRR